MLKEDQLKHAVIEDAITVASSKKLQEITKNSPDLSTLTEDIAKERKA